MSRAVAGASLFLLAVPAALLLLGSLLDPYTVRIPDALTPPGLDAPFGTDSLGRSYFGRVVVGMAVSIGNAATALVIGLLLAVVLGGVAGITADRWPDKCVRGLISLIYTLPFFLIVVAVAGITGLTVWAIPLLVASVIWPPAARLVRAEVIRVARSRFVLAQRAFGLPAATWWWQSIVPLTIAPALTTLFALLPEIVTIDVALSFFGLGVQPPTPTLGRLIYDGLPRLQAGWWLTGIPSVALLTYCLAAHAMHERLAATLRRATRT